VEKLSEEDLLECATMQTLFKERTVYVTEPEETSNNELVAGASRLFILLAHHGLVRMRVIARRVLPEAVES
jgi:hypothetical protein